MKIRYTVCLLYTSINFAITIGAMAAQIALLWVLEWQIPGIGGFLVAALMTIPIATLFGFLVGKLLNKMKGQEMIGGMILGYFANGLYQLLFLFVFGNLIPLHTDGLVIQGSTGVANTMDLSGAHGIRKSLDNLISLEFAPALYLFAGIIAVVMVIFYVRKSIRLSRLIAVLADVYKRQILIRISSWLSRKPPFPSWSPLLAILT